MARFDYSKYAKAKTFAAHGVEWRGLRGNQLFGMCPFSGKADKFYLNVDNWLWDSKSAGLSGNITTFLELIHKEYRENIGEDEYIALAGHRGIPKSELEYWDIGWSGDRYVLPVRDNTGHIVDLRIYDLETKQMRSTAGCNTGLIGAQAFKDDATSPVYLCEGEWDAMALRWLLRLNKAEGIVVGAPGAGTFKQEWVPWFSGRRVHVHYDHDAPGIKGELTVDKRLRTAVKSLQYVHWPEDLPDGFDVRDWVKYGVKQKKTPRLCLERLKALYQRTPRTLTPDATEEQETRQTVRLLRFKRPKPTGATLEDVHRVFREHMHLQDTDAVDLTLAVCASKMIEGDPVWMFLVGPPGSGKTMTMSGLTTFSHAYSTSSLTSHALISGHGTNGGGTDPSLIPRLDGKILLVKDFTSILSMRDTDKEEIFGILRDAFDGSCGKIFGNGIERNYKSRFTVLAAVTPRIYDVGEQHQSLGERFLKYAIGDNMEHVSEEDIISKAIENVSQSESIRDALAEVTDRYLTGLMEQGDVLAQVKMDNPTKQRLILLAQIGSVIRGTVTHHKYRDDIMLGRPFREVGTRLGTQLAKLARSLAFVRGRSEVGEEDYRLVKRVVLDTISQRHEDIIRTLFRMTGEAGADWVKIDDLVQRMRYPKSTVRRLLDDMLILQVVDKKRVEKQTEYRLAPRMHGWLVTTGLYATGETLNRPSRVVLRRKRTVAK